MSSPTTEVRSLITAEQAIEALRVLILYDEDFDPRHYSICQAEILERCAAAIRRGHAAAGGRTAQALGGVDDGEDDG